MSDFNITLFEACELLNRSKKSISRYIRRDLLHPKKVKSQQGTLEYRFSKADIEVFKTQEVLNTNESRQDTPDQTGQRGQTRQDTLKTENIKNKDFIDQTRQDNPEQTGQESEIITLLKDTTGFLKGQLEKKDEQIKDLGGKIDQLIERDRETNILLKGLQDKVLMLEKPKEVEQTNTETDKQEEIGQDTPETNEKQHNNSTEDTPETVLEPPQEIIKETEQAKTPLTDKQLNNKDEKGFWKQLFKSDL